MRENTVGAITEHKAALQQSQRFRHRPARGKGTEIPPLAVFRAAMFQQLGKIMIPRDKDIGIAFIVTQQDVEGRQKALNEIRLQQ